MDASHTNESLGEEVVEKKNVEIGKLENVRRYLGEPELVEIGRTVY